MTETRELLGGTEEKNVSLKKGVIDLPARQINDFFTCTPLVWMEMKNPRQWRAWLAYLILDDPLFQHSLFPFQFFPQLFLFG